MTLPNRMIWEWGRKEEGKGREGGGREVEKASGMRSQPEIAESYWAGQYSPWTHILWAGSGVDDFYNNIIGA